MERQLAVSEIEITIIQMWNGLCQVKSEYFCSHYSEYLCVVPTIVMIDPN